MTHDHEHRAGELFAGVGGFNLGLRAAGWKVVWSNQWEPSTKTKQHAYGCMRLNFGYQEGDYHSNKDISDIAAMLRRQAQDGHIDPGFSIDLLVGGFPCQDYSVAKPLSQSGGLHGRKGVLWWEIEHILRALKPRHVLLENVDRLLVSPSVARGRDFATILACFHALGYGVEWRVINAADYGEPQRRKRVFIYAERGAHGWTEANVTDPSIGVLARALPCRPVGRAGWTRRSLPAQIPDSSASQDIILGYVLDRLQPAFDGRTKSDFANAGVMSDGAFVTGRVVVDEVADARLHGKRHRHAEKRTVLDGILLSDEKLLRDSDGKSLFVDPSALKEWKRLKGPKADTRDASGFSYDYKEGGMPLFDDRHAASRTIVTGEGGSSPSRFKHLVEVDPSTISEELADALAPFLVRRYGPNDIVEEDLAGPYVQYSEKEMAESVVAGDMVAFRRLSPIELERLNGFPDNWTASYLDEQGTHRMSDSRRAFMMGNALVVGIVERIGESIKERADSGVRDESSHDGTEARTTA